MTYTSDEGRRELLGATAEAADTIAVALAALGEAYELVSDDAADRLEDELFGPVQAAFGRAKSTYGKFAGQHGLPNRTFGGASAGLPSTGAKGFIDEAVAAVANADGTLAELQDSGLPGEVGDVELRTGLRDIRAKLGDVARNARAIERTLGR